MSNQLLLNEFFGVNIHPSNLPILEFLYQNRLRLITKYAHYEESMKDNEEVIEEYTDVSFIDWVNWMYSDGYFIPNHVNMFGLKTCMINFEGWLSALIISNDDDTFSLDEELMADANHIAEPNGY